MGVKRLYGYVMRNLADSQRKVKIIDEIISFQSIYKRKPLIVINLSTLSYHQVNIKDLLCGYQLNKIKFEFEAFLKTLAELGCTIEFIFKRQDVDDDEWKKRRLDDYKTATFIIEKMRECPNLNELAEKFKSFEKFPYNPMILACLLQSAKKFGVIHGQNETNGIPALLQLQIIHERKADYVLGLDTYYFIFGGKFKIWSDITLNLESLEVVELDPTYIMNHFKLNATTAPIFAILSGDLKSKTEITRKISDHFGTKCSFENVARFLYNLPKCSSVEETIETIVAKIFGVHPLADQIIDDFFVSLERFEVPANVKLYDERMIEMQNDFMNIGLDILFNNQIFINPIFLDLRLDDMKSINELIYPLLQKTAGYLLQELAQPEPRYVIYLPEHDGEYVKKELKVEYSKKLVKFHPIDEFIRLNVYAHTEIMKLPVQHRLDIYVLIFLMQESCITSIEARIIMKTLVDVRARNSAKIPEYPETLNERAFRVSFLFSKIYFYLTSCLTALDMKNFYAEFRFDGVLFQNLYQLNNVMYEVEENINYFELIRDLGVIVEENLRF